MEALLNKLNFKGQTPILLHNLPADQDALLRYAQTVTEVQTQLAKVEQLPFALFFVTTLEEIEAIAQSLSGRLEGDPVLWFAYPKGSSKRYKCTFNRDTGWAALGSLGLEPVRMVAIDADWSALRFRRVAYIKTMSRSFGALSAEGAERIKQAKKPQ